MILQYILERWKKLLLTYLIGVATIFSLFVGINSFKAPYYHTNFVLKPSGLEVGKSVENLFELLMLKDTLAFATSLNFNYEEVARINAAEYDVLDGGFLKIELFTKDQGIIYPFYEHLVNYLTHDSLLDLNTSFARATLESEMKMIEEQLAQLDSSKGTETPAQWQFLKGSGPQPVAGASSSLNRVFLMNRLSELLIQHHNMVTVQPLIAPNIPLKPERSSKFVYFLFSNVLVISLMFVQYLFYSRKQEIA